MNSLRLIAGAGLVASALSLGNVVSAHGIGDFENASPKMVGGGWVAVGDVENREAASQRARLAVELPCPGEDVGFNPQPDPPGRLQVSVEQHTFHLEAMTSASCSNNLHEGSGTGRCGSERGFIINWRLIDGNDQGVGNPDIRPDTVELDIRGPSAACSLSLAGPLGGGDLKMQAPPEPD